jgi:hypothetical protein
VSQAELRRVPRVAGVLLQSIHPMRPPLAASAKAIFAERFERTVMPDGQSRHFEFAVYWIDGPWR